MGSVVRTSKAHLADWHGDQLSALNGFNHYCLSALITRAVVIHWKLSANRPLRSGSTKTEIEPLTRGSGHLSSGTVRTGLLQSEAMVPATFAPAGNSRWNESRQSLLDH